MLLCRVNNRVAAFELEDLPDEAGKAGEAPARSVPFRDFALRDSADLHPLLRGKFVAYGVFHRMFFFRLEDIKALEKRTGEPEGDWNLVPVLPPQVKVQG